MTIPSALLDSGAYKKTMIDYALMYAERGWPVVPFYTPDEQGRCSCLNIACPSIGKHPRTGNGVSDATTDPHVIQGWWTRWPDANIGVSTGKVSGIVALDIDPRNGGDESLDAMEAEHGALPDTLTAYTGGGGEHRLFRYPDYPIKNSSSKLGKGLDVKGDRGMILVAPSLHLSGKRYEWKNDSPVTKMPAWLFVEVTEPPKIPEKRKAEIATGEVICEGERNATLASLAGSMRHKGMSSEAIIAALLAENIARCEPPLPELEVRNIAASISRYAAGARDAGDASDDGHGQRRSQATQLVELADVADFFHTPERKAYAFMPVGEHREIWPLSSKQFRQWLARRFYETFKRTPSAQAITDALGVLEGKALFEGEEHKVHMRVAEHDGAIYLDLCDSEWRAVEVTATGWQVVAQPPTRFRRTKSMLALPQPVRGGSLDELRDFINVRPEDEPLVRAWLAAAMRPKGAYPILALHGEQGSAKTTTGRVLCELVDPNEAALRSEPPNERDMMITASNRWVVAFDNLSRISPSLSDAMCRLATGGGFATRQLHTDDDEIIFSVQRPMMLNGIEELANRSDLLDRTILLYLPAIPEERRMAEEHFWQRFREARPRILGALLETLSGALRNVGTVRLEKRPRMADFALWATAAEMTTRERVGAFMEAYNENREAANKLAVESSPFVEAIINFVTKQGHWEGTATVLLSELNEVENMKTQWLKIWPKTPQSLSNQLRRYTPNLRKVGIDVDFERTGEKRSIRLACAPIVASQASSSSQTGSLFSVPKAA